MSALKGLTQRWDQQCLAQLFELLPDLPGAFTASIHDSNLNGRVFGGQLLAQALAAAQQLHPQLMPATLHCLFLQGAQTDLPLHFRVTQLQHGKRFCNLLVSAQQGDRRVLEAQVTLQTPISGFFHMTPASDIPGPEHLLALDQLEDGSWASFARPFVELRIVDPQRYLRHCPAQPAIAYWLKLRTRLPCSPAVHNQALAYLSDYWINSAAISYHLPVEHARARLFVSSMNHSVWYHRPVVADDWLLFVGKSHSLQNGRGLTQARVYDRARNLVASVAQDCLVGERDTPAAG
ncbi:acyl-CoA thioesterase II [Pseudomonas capeferrum]|uniref:acyl-CoA thioesterase n=1 Tax=Pseudomonas capeferrum TaxID=1495066 RepID=UPI0015E3FE07|nr:acyl-CoA thioesterase domain-containing protein [Pseudomonas capeferrum]MBA1204271.1 acyl-CoA thioesterase II [Pseudomonas capeferrum]